jgi:tetratricopeptide (TPR) repeat protein
MGTTNIKLLKLAQEAQGWSYVVRAARDAFSDAYELPGLISADIPHAIENDDYPLVLAAHMAALALVDAAAHGEPAPLGDIAITEYLLGRERTYWMDLHEADPVRFSTDSIVMARTVFTATLAGPLAYEEGTGTLRRIEAVETGQPVASVIADHAACYPPTDPAMVLESLYPDRLGEDFIALSVPGHNITPQKNSNTIELADPWAKEAAFRLINTYDGQLPTWLASVISVLVETSKRWSHIAEKQLYPIVREQPNIMLLAGGSTLASFSDMPSVPIELLEEIEGILPGGRDSDLAIGRAVLAERLADFRLARTNDPVRRGEIYTKLRSALRSAGLHEKEVVVTGEAVECYRGLSRADPEEYMAAFAIALDAHSSALMMNGNVDASIESGNEAVAIYRRLYSVRPHIFGDEFARTLTNLGNSLLRKHLVSDALRLQQEAVTIRRAIGTAPGFEPQDVRTAGSLVQLSVTMVNHGRSDEALDLISQAVDIYRSALTSDEVSLELGVFAHALEIRGRILTLRNMYSEALEPLQEAIDILRPLIVSNPAVHLGLLSQSLSELAVCLLKLDQIPEGIDALQEAVEIFPDELSPRIEPNFVAMLGNLGAALTLVGRADEAVVILTDAVDKSRILAEQDPHAQALLPFTLSSLSAALMRLNEWEGALPIAKEAENLYRELVRTARESHIESWRKARDTLATVLESLGRHEEASRARSEEL